MLVVLGSVVNMMGGGGGDIWSLDEHENLRFIDE